MKWSGTGSSAWSPGRLQEKLLHYTGITAHRWQRLPPGLYVFTFHRIGERGTTRFDPNVFSCSAEAFAAHLAMIGRHFSVIAPGDLDQVIADAPRERHALLTFDDGYRDNLEIAVPVMRARGMSAVFFVATAMVDSDSVPWWDHVAHMVRHAGVHALRFSGATVPIVDRPAEAAIRDVLRLLKAEPGDLQEKLEWLEEALQPSMATPRERQIMDWRELREARAAGMTIGSHTVSHRILSHLNRDQQREELTRSREALELKLGVPVTLLAYPVGGAHSFNQSSRELAEEAGYRYAFTTIAACNRWDSLSPYTLGRIAVSTPSTGELRYQLSKLSG